MVTDILFIILLIFTMYVNVTQPHDMTR